MKTHSHTLCIVFEAKTYENLLQFSTKNWPRTSIGAYCHEPCTATAHGRPTLLRTDLSHAHGLFETVIECTATDHVIFSRCIYISFHGNLLPLA